MKPEEIRHQEKVAESHQCCEGCGESKNVSNVTRLFAKSPGRREGHGFGFNL